jgi:predicted ATPase/class 3 adenylate cyclase
VPACATCGKLSADDARFCPNCGSPLAAEPPLSAKVRKTVTVVFADVTGSTELGERLDPETVQQLMERYFTATRDVLERHGGTVEKFIGDAVMAVFGIPVVHEDDALRATRAAVEIVHAVARLSDELQGRWGVSLQVRIGVNTGEVVAGDPSSGQAFATGDAVNVAARLEQAAQPGQILIGETTYRIVRDQVEATPAESLAVKGKSELITASRVLGVEPDAPLPFAPHVPFVGREAELQLLEEAFERCVEERTSLLVTVVGEPGIGKSRLVREALERIGTAATIVVGRCPPYGEGITYLPLLDIVRQIAPGGRPDLASLVEGDEDGERIADYVSGAVGLLDASPPSEETSWAVRRIFEVLAGRRPLVVVLDDIHWAEPTFLDLVDHVAHFARAVPLLIVCLARPELLGGRLSWQSLSKNATTFRLGPLSADESRALLERDLDARVDPQSAARVLEAAEGNPLFLEQLLAMQSEDGDDVGVPPTIQALLAARIDRLPPEERGVIQRAAVQGRVFSRRALAELVGQDEAAMLDETLASLERRELVRRDPPALGGDDGFCFAHGLIRDAAYQFLPKKTRSQLHERLANWLERAEGVREYEEVIGYHLEQAYRYRADLAPIGDEELALAAAAAQRLEASGRRALAMADLPAAINLLERALLLAHEEALRAALLPALGSALAEAGRLDVAERILAEAVRLGKSLGDERLEAHARVEQLFLRLQVNPEAATKQARRLIGRLVRAFEASGDEVGLSRLWRLRGLLYWLEARTRAADDAWERAAEHARRAGDERELAEILQWLASSALMGPIPAAEGIRRCEEIRWQVRDDRRAEAVTLNLLGALYAMTRRFDVADELVEAGQRTLEDLGCMILSAGFSQQEGFVATLAGDHARAEERLRRGCARLEELGEKALLSSTAALLAHAIYAQGRYDEARRFTQLSEDAAAPDDLAAQIAWRRVRAKILAKEGALEEAEILAREAVALAEQTDQPNQRGDALLDLGEVLQQAGRAEEAETAVREAVALYEQKGNLVSAEKARALLVELACVRDFTPRR